MEGVIRVIGLMRWAWLSLRALDGEFGVRIRASVAKTELEMVKAELGMAKVRAVLGTKGDAK